MQSYKKFMNYTNLGLKYPIFYAYARYKYKVLHFFCIFLRKYFASSKKSSNFAADFALKTKTTLKTGSQKRPLKD